LLTKGEPLTAILGDGPATTERCEPGGDPSFVPPYDDSKLVDTDFSSGRALIPVSPFSRDKGWRGWPLGVEPEGEENGLIARIDEVPGRHAFLGPMPGATTSAGSRAILAQEIRSARGGEYEFIVMASGVGHSREQFEHEVLGGLSCRLVLYRFADASKNPMVVQELGTLPFRPEFGEARPFVLRRYLGSTQGNVNFPIGQGLGVAIVVEHSGGSPVTWEAKPGRVPGGVVIHGVSLSFSARPRHENIL
jgi:hypothetical protein